MGLERFVKLLLTYESGDKADAQNVRTLKRGRLGFWHLFFQSVSMISPAGAMAATMTSAANYAWGALPFSYILAIIAGTLLMNTTVWYSMKVASSGGYYAYVFAAVGPRWGLICGMMFILAYFNVVTNAILFVGGVFFPGFISTMTGASYAEKAWIGIMFAFILLIYILAFLGIRASLDYSLVIGTFELVFMFACTLAVIIKVGSKNTGEVFHPSLAPTRADIAIAALLSLFSISGYSAATFLGEEVKNPRRQIPIAVILAYSTVALLFFFMSYGLTVGWGYKDMSQFAASLVPGVIVYKRYLTAVIGWFMVVLILNAMFLGALAPLNSCARMIFAFAREGLVFPKIFAVVDKKQNPVVSTAVVAFLATIVALIAGLAMGPFDGFIMLVTTASLALYVGHIIANLTLGIFYYRQKQLNWFFHVVVPVVASILVGFSIFFTMYPYDPVTLACPIWTGVWLILSIIGGYLTPRDRLDAAQRRFERVQDLMGATYVKVEGAAQFDMSGSKNEPELSVEADDSHRNSEGGGGSSKYVDDELVTATAK
ncbi:Cationic amino acid transporter 2 [Galdieria sulphuraria]|uniref:Amino acid permease, APC family n=1 Tax=Galdieria sulphuraria TaxID=130081 RepID=M2WPV2_GALSU|nr:amino acid permease, APC family [Galdieria sulphuraria]EME25805.1 amino acid permease, APC family [Galdieria sulphuraria]GJD09053.1 Cationic amino acid transporter 2 [Galdieria sulphuraria]|eukprot:XP_005702325.1 amino acid permease, APC family [Galdieria sulphuraria]